MAVLLQALALGLLAASALSQQYEEGRQVVIPIPVPGFPVGFPWPTGFPLPVAYPLPAGFPLTAGAYQSVLPQILDTYNAVLQATASQAAATAAIINTYIPAYQPVVAG